MDGAGEMTYHTTNHHYVGRWRDNKKNGRGLFTFADGNTYDGDFLDDIQHGYGKLVYMPTTILEESYEGEWQDGLRQGRGVYRYREQDAMKSYDGDWLSNLRHGKGQLEYRDGGYYKGDWVNERMTGRGLYVWPDGSQYEGQTCATGRAS
ncbi:hypothetical protein JL720_190 [Aureococcus anophagefferens]|nr:hypothetical protein JL720_190 [Aureococcus anophagefferens]